VVDQPLLVTELSRFARMLVTDYPVSDALHDFVDAAAAVLGVHGAGISLAKDDRLAFATATPEDIRVLEEVQEADQVGPCTEAYRARRAVLVADLATRSGDWPDLVTAAGRMGIAAVGSVPLLLDAHCLGTLDLYQTHVHEWTDDERSVAGLFAAFAAGYLVNSSRLRDVRETADQLQEALDSRVIIEQAKGVLAGERGVSVDEAFRDLRAHARSRGAALRDVASAVVNLGLRP